MFTLPAQMSLARKSVCLSVGPSVCRSVCRRVFYLGVQMFCSETLSWSPFSTYYYPACIHVLHCTVQLYVSTCIRIQAG